MKSEVEYHYNIKGLSDDSNHAVQQEWIKEQFLKFRYCQSGHILTPLAFLMRDQNPTEKIINSKMTGLCHCGTYPRIPKAIRKTGQMLETNNA